MRLPIPLLALLAVLSLLGLAGAMSSSAARERRTDPPGEEAVPSLGVPADSRATRGSVAPRGRSEAPPRRLQVARVLAGRSLVVRERPGGAVEGRLADRTRFGSRSVVAVATERGEWLGVASEARSDGRLGWISKRSSAIELAPARLSLRADLSRRTLELRAGPRVTRRVRIAVGRPGSRTPTGSFAVTDKLDGRRYGPYYGCCILAMSGIQPNTPPGWKGGNRLAIHGTDAPGTIGRPSSAGCLRASDRDLEALMRAVPVGTLVEVRR